MTFIDFFAGVGGFRKGLENAGHKCVGFCEFDKYAVASYTAMHLITEEQRAYLMTLDKKKRLKEILKDEYRNGEWFATDIRLVTGQNVPRADCWCFGAPCQDFSIAGNRAGLDGDRSSLVRQVFRILRELQEADRPEWLIYENVKGMFSSNRGGDYLSILLEMDELGYDAEWFTFNSKYHGVPQNRERVYTVGHLRGRGSAKVFPLKGTDREDRVERIDPESDLVLQIGECKSERNNPNQYRVYDPIGVGAALNTMGGGGREPSTIVKVGERKREGRQEASEHLVIDPCGDAPTLTSSVGGGKCPEVAIRAEILKERGGLPIMHDGYNGKDRNDHLVGTITRHMFDANSRAGQTVVLPVQYKGGQKLWDSISKRTERRSRSRHSMLKRAERIL